MVFAKIRAVPILVSGHSDKIAQVNKYQFCGLHIFKMNFQAPLNLNNLSANGIHSALF